MKLAVVLSDIACVVCLVLLGRKFIYQLILCILPGGRKWTIMLPMAVVLALIVILLEWFDFSSRYYPSKIRYVAAMVLLGAAVCFVTGYIPYKKSLELSHLHYRKATDEVYSFAPNISFIDPVAQPGTGKAIKYFINGEGNRECPYSGGERENNIILSGDSYVFGLYLNTEDTLCAKLGEELKGRGGQPFTIRNLGVAGLNLHSAIKAATLRQRSLDAEWVVFSYLTRNDFAPYDTFFELRSLQESTPYKLLAVIFGPNTLTRALNWHNNRYTNREPEQEWFSEDANALRELSARSNVVLILYWGEDSFTKYVEKNLTGIKILKFDMRINSENEKRGLTIPGDGHPTGKANRMISEALADVIANDNAGENSANPHSN